MGLMETLRKAEEQAKAAARKGLARAHDEWEEAERKMRQKMRVFPTSTVSSAQNSVCAIVPEVQPETDLPLAELPAPKPDPIISIHGRDVNEREVNGSESKSSDRSAA